MKSKTPLIISSRSRFALRIKAWGKMSVERQNANTSDEASFLKFQQDQKGNAILEDLLHIILDKP